MMYNSSDTSTTLVLLRISNSKDSTMGKQEIKKFKCGTINYASYFFISSTLVTFSKTCSYAMLCTPCLISTNMKEYM